MASYSVSRAKHASYAATVVDDVTLTMNKHWIQVINLGTTNPLYITIGPSTGIGAPIDPTVAGDDTICVPASGRILVRWPSVGTTSSAKVKTISAGNGTFSIQCVDSEL